jgi:RNA polymerase sigma factor (sigma-70 family)
VYDTVAQLTCAVARGEEAAVEAFYRRFFDVLYRHARQVSRRDESFCLDVVQDAMLRIVRSLRAVPTEPQLVAWLKLVVQSVTYDALRRERRRREREAGRSRNGDHVALEPDERLAWLRQELLALDPELVRLIELRFVHGWTLARMAQTLGLTVGTIDGRLRRALDRIRRRATDVCAD